jgi:signal transduction histidine kinase
MNDIINELLLLAEVRKQDVQRDKIDMAEIVEKAQVRLGYSISKLAADVHIPQSWPTVLGYGPWIEEVWVNYMHNALKYGGTPPKIWLGVDKQLDEHIGTLYYRFWIRDNGDGIPLEDQPALFSPFSRLGRIRTKGHGLGLSIVRRIIEKLEGSVGVVSTGLPGEGCLFYFTLPAIDDK